MEEKGSISIKGQVANMAMAQKDTLNYQKGITVH